MNQNTGIPFLDLATPHLELEEDLVEVFRCALKTASFIGGPVLEEFEAAFARFCDAEHCIGVASGTDAIRFALMAAGIKKGDVVITVPNTFIATTEAVSQAGGVVEFVDIKETTYNMDIEKLARYLEIECHTSDTGHAVSRRSGGPVTAVIPVHLYGQPIDMDPLLDLAEKYKFTVIEDSCQAHGARYFSMKKNAWSKAGSLGKAAAFSFYPGKNLGACGEAGAITTNDASLAATARMLRDHGQSRKYFHEMEGYNGRLDAIQAGFLAVKLKHLQRWNEQRKDRAHRYHTLLKGVEGLELPFFPSWADPVFHLYVVRTDKRDALQQWLDEHGIGTGLHYPIPLHRQNAYREMGYPEGSFEVAETMAGEILSLPLYPGLTDSMQDRVVELIRRFFVLHRNRPSIGRAAL